MSSWTRETTADIGLRVFSNNLPNLFKEAAVGMQNLIISDSESRKLNQKIRYTSQWNVKISINDELDYESLMILWLEEVLYRLEVHGEFLVDAQCMIDIKELEMSCQCQVSWVESAEVDREIEIKAVTSHEFLIQELNQGESYLCRDLNIPEIVGPGWICDVIFDI
ncbi:MAG: archease [Euryarchaeota archaeon]|jgi:SHS2 domain-containing protein|nr:archease [Euryarchaeota archaeon]MBT7987342.1 archease [Euryarchaeota archaeon]